MKINLSEKIKQFILFFNFFSSFWFYILNIFLVFIFLFLFYISWITYKRLLIFILILLYIYLYKVIFYIINELKLKKILIKNNKILNFLWFIHKWSNPLLRLVLIIENKYIVTLLQKEQSFFVKLIIFLVFILLINPIKIFFIKYFSLLSKWKNYSYLNITRQRLIGFIISVLCIAQLINFILLHSSFNTIVLIYLLIIILNLINKWLQPFINPRVLKFWHLEQLSLKEIFYRRIHISWFGQLLVDSEVSIRNKYNRENNFLILHKFKISFTWFMINNFYNLYKKPSYQLLRWISSGYEISLINLPDAIFIMHYYKELCGENLIICNDNTTISLPKELKAYVDLEQVNWIQIRAVYEFQFLVYKFLLFLVWDIEIYIGNEIKDVPEYFIYKNIIINDALDSIALQHIFLVSGAMEYYRVIKDKDNLNFNIEAIFNKLKIYNFCNIITVDPSFKHKYLEVLDTNCINEVLRVCQYELGPGPLEIYIEHINTIYTEYKTIPLENKMDYYTMKLNIVEIEYKKLKKLLLNEK